MHVFIVVKKEKLKKEKIFCIIKKKNIYLFILI